MLLLQIDITSHVELRLPENPTRPLSQTAYNSVSEACVTIKSSLSKDKIIAQAIAEYKLLIKEEKGIDLSDKESAEQAIGLLNLFQILTEGQEK